jgi:hypothetical protein
MKQVLWAILAFLLTLSAFGLLSSLGRVIAL